MNFLEENTELFSRRIVKRAYEQRIPFSGTFELLPICNMRCRMCYIQHNPKQSELQPIDFWVDLFRQAIDAGMLSPLLTGGEVFLYPGFFELYERLIQMPVYLTINTNATLLNREKVKRLAKNPPKRINISLYGASDETYAALCGNPQGYTQVTRAFDLLKEYGIPFKVNGVLVPENAADYQGIVDTCNRYRVPLSMSNYMFPPYRKENGCASAQGRFSPEEMARYSLKYMRDCHFSSRKDYAKQVWLYCAAMEHPEIYNAYGKDEVPCKGGLCSFWVDWRGYVSACGIHNQGKVDLHAVPLGEAWRQVVAHTENTRMSSACKTCRYRCICPVCPAANFCETGDLNGTPEYLCRFCEAYGQLLFEERRRLFENA